METNGNAPPLTRVKAVRIACDGEKDLKNGFNEYEIYNILPDHDIFTTGEFSQPSVLAGVPLVVIKIKPSLIQPKRNSRTGGRQSWKKTGTEQYGYGADEVYFPNPKASTLMINCGLLDEEVANGSDALDLLQVPRRWSQTVGSVLVARADKQPLYTHHVDILTGFIPTVTIFGMSDAEHGHPGQAAQAAVCRLRPEAFRAFYEEWMRTLKPHQRGQLDYGFAEPPSPFAEEASAAAEEGTADFGDVQMQGVTQTA